MPFDIEIMPSALVPYHSHPAQNGQDLVTSLLGSGSSGLGELKAIAVFHRRRVVQAIDDLLMHQPTTETKNRKLLDAPITAFDCEPPIWELRVGKYRVFYDVDESTAIVSVRAIREKPPHTTTEGIL